ncbi:MAG TPA: SLBB domain-containing protein [Terracidiphilus sp.]|nr:SLBB domain-containing protein [Terracidiphilus sp.]
MLLLTHFSGASAAAQWLTSSDSTRSTAQSSSDTGNDASPATLEDSRLGQGTLGASVNSVSLTPPSLSADQIISLLQQNPDLTDELKSQLADRMQQQGMQIDPNNISDQMLYNQITTNTSLRASITSVLRTRGYISDEDLQSFGASVTEGDTLSSVSAAPEAGASAPGAAQNESAAEVLTGEPTSQSTEGEPSTTGSPTARSESNGASSTETPRRRERVNTSTDAPKVTRLPAPYELQSMRDLYTQIPNDAEPLRRFGSDVFLNRSAGSGVSARNAPLDVALGPDYVVGPGDTLQINLWGGVTQSITRTVSRDGRIFLPEAGSIEVAGLSLAKAQDVIESALKQEYRNAEVAVSVSNLRSVRVYIVGDVQRPGGYDVSSLATPVSALYAAGGPTAAGSLRVLLHYRGTEVVEKVDLYDFLLHGVRAKSVTFESGDTLLVPPAGEQVAILGAIKRPAIYELANDKATLAEVVEEAGGFTASASISHIRIERIGENHQRETVTLPGNGAPNAHADQDALTQFHVRDGDRIYVDPILPYSQRVVYLTGHVVRPGRLPYSDGMHLSDVLHSYQDMLPEPAARGEIVHLVPPDLHAETINFDVPEVLIGNQNFGLQPFDTIRVFGRYQVDAPTVTVRGEVLRPGKYPMSKGMTAAQLVRMAGGFKRDALLESADLTSYDAANGHQIVEQLTTLQIGAAVAGTDPRADVPLKPGDILSVHQITNWENIGESVTVRGEVRYPGSYGFQDGERLSSVLRRAGGLLPTAYPMGAVLVRMQVRELEEKSRDELIRQIETNSAAARLSPSLAGANGAAALQLINVQQAQVISDLKNHPPTGRMVIHITPDIDSWANTSADIELRQGDVLTIPKRPGFVLVTGQVYNATALTFTPGKNAGWYLNRAGGTNSTANRKEIFIIRANGSIVGRHSGGWFEGDVLSTVLNPGDVIVVPQKIIGGSLIWRNLLSAGQLAGSVAITAGVAAAAL